MAKFLGDRPTELGDLVAKKKQKETSAVKHKTTGNYRSGWSNKDQLTDRLNVLEAHDLVYRQLLSAAGTE